MKYRTLAIVLMAALAGPLTGAAAPELPPLGVADDGRSFTAGGAPFFWLGDTAWGLLDEPDRAQVERYLDIRAAQGFTVVQTAIPVRGDWSRVDAPHAVSYTHLTLPTTPYV